MDAFDHQIQAGAALTVLDHVGGVIVMGGGAVLGPQRSHRRIDRAALIIALKPHALNQGISAFAAATAEIPVKIDGDVLTAMAARTSAHGQLLTE